MNTSFAEMIELYMAHSSSSAWLIASRNTAYRERMRVSCGATASCSCPTPQIWESLTPEMVQAFASAESIQRLPASASRLTGPGILANLSFTHLTELLSIDDPVKRIFYEQQCIAGGWSVRELRRQIASLLYERTGLSRDTAALLALANEKAELATPLRSSATRASSSSSASSPTR